MRRYEISGFLLKKRPKRTFGLGCIWQKFFFAFSKDLQKIEYSRNPGSIGSPQGVIPLSVIEKIDYCPEEKRHNDRRFCLVIRGNDRIFHLKASCVAERDNWFLTLQTASQSSTSRKISAAYPVWKKKNASKFKSECEKTVGRSLTPRKQELKKMESKILAEQLKMHAEDVASPQKAQVTSQLEDSQNSLPTVGENHVVKKLETIPKEETSPKAPEPELFSLVEEPEPAKPGLFHHQQRTLSNLEDEKGPSKLNAKSKGKHKSNSNASNQSFSDTTPRLIAQFSSTGSRQISLKRTVRNNDRNSFEDNLIPLDEGWSLNGTGKFHLRSATPLTFCAPARGVTPTPQHQRVQQPVLSS